MTGHLAHIIRHPIKSVGYEEIESAPLQEGRALPFDRIWAISHEGAAFDGPLDHWAPKRNFLRGAAAPELMAITAQTTGEGIMLNHPGQWHALFDPTKPEDCVKLIEWVRPFWPLNRPALRAVERVADVTLGDMEEPYISILSLASLARLSEAADAPVSMHRFRGNLWVSGWEAGAERDLIGRRLRIDEAELEVVMPITRCKATCANPETGAQDLKTLELLQSIWGDTQFGLYAKVVRAGEILTGDRVEIL